MLIPRTHYLEQLIRKKHNELIKIVTGIRIHTRKGGTTDGGLDAEIVEPFLLALLSLDQSHESSPPQVS